MRVARAWVRRWESVTHRVCSCVVTSEFLCHRPHGQTSPDPLLPALHVGRLPVCVQDPSDPRQRGACSCRPTETPALLVTCGCPVVTQTRRLPRAARPLWPLPSCPTGSPTQGHAVLRAPESPGQFSVAAVSLSDPLSPGPPLAWHCWAPNKTAAARKSETGGRRCCPGVIVTVCAAWAVAVESTSREYSEARPQRSCGPTCPP